MASDLTSTDTLDLMRDEFLRIQAIAGPDSEIGNLCDRAVVTIEQRVPVFVQRDNAIRERDAAHRLLWDLHARAQALADDLARSIREATA